PRAVPTVPDRPGPTGRAARGWPAARPRRAAPDRRPAPGTPGTWQDAPRCHAGDSRAERRLPAPPAVRAAGTLASARRGRRCLRLHRSFRRHLETLAQQLARVLQVSLHLRFGQPETASDFAAIEIVDVPQMKADAVDRLQPTDPEPPRIERRL